MNKAVAGTLMAAALVGAFLLGRASRDPHAGQSASIEMGRGPPSRAAMAPESILEPVDGKTGARPAAGVTSPALAPANSTVSADTGQAAATPINTGPRPLTEEGQAKLRDWTRKLAAHDATTEDLLELSDSEAADTDAAYLESLIAASIRRHGATSIRLQLSPPHCTRTLCTVRGIGTRNTQDPSADWQRLTIFIMNEPWFREYFVDQRTFVGGDREVLYLSFFIRK
ncbi:MAG TPA: hypothetical protein VN017_06590 [Pseudoxanthomonas sp.]|nr:hypothetical protein [Pseudoxanthomonas sp.]